MDTNDPLITFDSQGFCNHCTEFLGNRLRILKDAQQGSDSLGDLFERIRHAGRNSKYDCVLGISGGVDSSYMAVLAAQHGLRVLAVHLDNSWNSKIAVENIRTLVTSLKMDYASYVLPWTEFRQVQLAFLRASVPEAETPTDVAIQRSWHHHALRNGVKYILSGGNIQSEGILPASWHYNARDTKYSYAILDAGGCSRSNFKKMKFGAAEEVYCKIFKGIRIAYPLNCVTYDKGQARDILERDHGWKYYGTKHGESRFTRFIQNYYLFVKHGIDYRRATMSSEILLGQCPRDAALNLLKTPPYAGEDIESESDYVAKKLGISRGDLDSIIAAPPKWYFDYPNNERMLGLLYDAYRKATGRRKAAQF